MIYQDYREKSDDRDVEKIGNQTIKPIELTIGLKVLIRDFFIAPRMRQSGAWRYVATQEIFGSELCGV